jgi:hypothetical protein
MGTETGTQQSLYSWIEDRQEAKLLRTVKPAGITTVARVTEIGSIQRFRNSQHLACFLNLVTSGHISAPLAGQPIPTGHS